MEPDHHKRLSQVSRSIVIIFILAIMSIAIVNVFIFFYINKVEQKWQQHESLASKKILYLSQLRDGLGYGGMIHNFKNFVIRKKLTKMSEVHQNEQARRAVTVCASAIVPP